MTQAEKLEALVRKAVENGWQGLSDWEFDLDSPELIAKEAFDKYVPYNHLDIIFSHDFARALFGDKRIPYSFDEPEHTSFQEMGMTTFHRPAFEVRLMAAVISKDPIDYYYQTVFGGKDAI